MKKALALILLFAMCFALCACGGNSNESSETNETQTTEELNVPENNDISIDLIAVDDSYRDRDESPLRMVYVFYTLSPQDENMSISTTNHVMTINDKNEYSSEHFPGVTDMMPNYYNSDYIEHVYVGSELKVCITLKVPEGDLGSGKPVSLRYNGLPDLDFTTDDFKHFNNKEELAAEVDPEGYATWKEDHEPADGAEIARVAEAINGYQWDFYVNSTSYQIEFMSPNLFELRVPKLNVANDGTYTVQKGYVVITYENGSTVEIPYSWGDSDIDLHVVDAFDVSG